MSNLRILYDNAADRATITADSTAGSLAAANLKTDRKSVIHRSVGTSVSYTLVWPSAETVSAVAIPACNLTASATIRVRAWDDPAAGALLLDTGAQLACPGQALTSSDWGAPVTAALFGFGAASKVAAWLPETAGVRRMQIDLSDAGNPAGALDVARLVVGKYWSPQRGPASGGSYSSEGLGQATRSDAGGLIVDRAPSKEVVSITLPVLWAEDRAELDKIMRLCGTHRMLFVAISVGADSALDHATLIYGARSNAPISVTHFALFGGALTIESW